MEKKAIDEERRKLDEEIRKFNENVERIRREEAIKRKKHQDDLIYQISEKELQKKKEINDKNYEEREAKVREIEYAKKIAEQREIHKKKVINIIYSLVRRTEKKWNHILTYLTNLNCFLITID